ncbi:unnamed protein product [Caenorhabditis bovis]|uniref:PHD-type domain-containing protein n=1 Tax=Caenorhabditis bovis TaxID=2654633 RepID=A0A8S1E9D6_9PELO|nr:unnamed protein product [Caenorhabditis bovis]
MVRIKANITYFISFSECDICTNGIPSSFDPKLNNIAYCGVHPNKKTTYFCNPCGKHLCECCISENPHDFFTVDHLYTRVNMPSPRLEDTMLQSDTFYSSLTRLKLDIFMKKQAFLQRSKNLRNNLGNAFLAIINTAIGRFCEIDSRIQKEEEKLCGMHSLIDENIDNAMRRIRIGKEMDDLARSRTLFPDDVVSDCYKSSAQKIFKDAITLNNTAINLSRDFEKSKIEIHSNIAYTDVIKCVAGLFGEMSSSVEGRKINYKLDPFSQLITFDKVIVEVPFDHLGLKDEDFSTSANAVTLSADGFSKFNNALTACKMSEEQKSRVRGSMRHKNSRGTYSDKLLEQNKNDILKLYSPDGHLVTNNVSIATNGFCSTRTGTSSKTIRNFIYAFYFGFSPFKFYKCRVLTYFLAAAFVSRVYFGFIFARSYSQPGPSPGENQGNDLLQPHLLHNVNPSMTTAEYLHATRGTRPKRTPSANNAMHIPFSELVEYTKAIYMYQFLTPTQQMTILRGAHMMTESMNKLSLTQTQRDALMDSNKKKLRALIDEYLGPQKKQEEEEKARALAAKKSSKAKQNTALLTSKQTLYPVHRLPPPKRDNNYQQQFDSRATQCVPKPTYDQEKYRPIPTAYNPQHLASSTTSSPPSSNLAPRSIPTKQTQTPRSQPVKQLPRVQPVQQPTTSHQQTIQQPTTSNSSQAIQQQISSRLHAFQQCTTSRPKSVQQHTASRQQPEQQQQTSDFDLSKVKVECEETAEDVKPDVMVLKKQMEEARNQETTDYHPLQDHSYCSTVEEEESTTNNNVVQNGPNGRLILRLPASLRSSFKKQESQSHETASNASDVQVIEDEDKESVRTFDDDGTHRWCFICNDERFDIADEEKGICTTCPKVFHRKCTIPQMRVPWEADENWQCIFCRPIPQLVEPTYMMNDRNRHLCSLVLAKCFLTRRATMFLVGQGAQRKTFSDVAHNLEPDSHSAYQTVMEFIRGLNEVFIQNSASYPSTSVKGTAIQKVWVHYSRAVKKHLPEYASELWLYLSLYSQSSSKRKNLTSSDHASSTKKRRN